MARHLHVDEVVSEGGLVCAPDPRAADAGAAILAAGGNAVDAAVATAFAVGALEPYFSGVGGGAWMVIGLREPDRYLTVTGPMTVPADATPDMFQVVSDQPAGLYGWPEVAGAANIVGGLSVLAPAGVAALCLAQDTWGRLDRTKVLRSAVEFANDGADVNWLCGAVIATDARNLVRDPGCASTFMRDGLPLRGPSVEPPDRLVQPALGRTLEAIAAGGAPAFYSGEIARSMVAAVRSQGGMLSMDDLGCCQARVSEHPLVAEFRGVEVIGPQATGVPSVIEALRLFQAARASLGGHPSLAWAYALRRAFVDRFAYMTADPEASVPWSELLSEDHAARAIATDVEGRPDALRTDAPASGGCTSHISVVDRWGNMVSLTQTVLDVFGARLLDPETGVLFNDGAMHFDPRPGRLNSVRPGVPGLSAVCPIILRERGKARAALGGSGGRRIISRTAQLVAALAGAWTPLQQAIETPPLHAEPAGVVADARLPSDAVERLHAAGFAVQVVEEEPTTWHFARPYGLWIDAEGRRRSGIEPSKPGGACAA